MAEKQILGFEPAAGLEQVRDEYSERVRDRKHRLKKCNDSARLVKKLKRRKNGGRGKSAEALS